MLSEERIMEIAECCPVWYAIPQGREKALLTKFARAIEREAASTLIRNLEIEESEMTNESKQEDVRGMVPTIDRSDEGTCYYPNNEEPADCPRCAELELVVRAIGNFIGKEYLVAWADEFLSDIVIQLLTERDKQLAAQNTVNNGAYFDKLATLEAELSGLRARYLRMESENAATIAQQAERIKELERETEEYDAALLATDADEIVKASPTLEVK